MTVYCNSGFSQDIWNKALYTSEFMSGMIYHFQNINFGKGVKEVVYIAICGDSVFLLSYGPGTTYGRKNKSIGALFFMDYETVQSLEGEALLRYIGQQLIENTKKFAEKKIKDFDLEGFIKSLREYLEEAM